MIKDVQGEASRVQDDPKSKGGALWNFVEHKKQNDNFIVPQLILNIHANVMDFINLLS